MPRCRAVALLLLAAARADDRTCAAPGNCDASVLDLPLFADRRHSLAGDALADTDWVSLGQRALEAGDARAAVQLMAAATKKLPFAGVVWQNLGVLLLDEAAGDAAEARVACEARAALELAGLLGAPADAPDVAAAAARCPRRDWAGELMRLGSVATYDYPYFNLRLTSLEVEAETLRRAKTRAVGGLYSWRASGARGGWRGFSLHQRVPPTHHPRWYSNIAYDNTPSALKAVLDEFDPSRSASRALSPFHWRGASARHSNVRWNACVRHIGRIWPIGAQAARDRHSPNMLSRPAAG